MVSHLRAALSLALAALFALGGCKPEVATALPSSPLRAPHAPVDAKLFLHYPQLDQRIVRIDPRKPQTRLRYYPDHWQPDTRAVRDFAVDGRRLYVLVAGWQRLDDRQLYVVDQESGKLVSTLPLEAQAVSLAWVAPQRLAICHATAHRGPLGRLTLVDTVDLRVLARIPLEGACQSLVAAAGRAFVIERRTRRLSAKEVLISHSLVSVDLAQRKAVTRRRLAAGARQVTLGPKGLLYVSLASGGGRHVTDGSIAVYEPEALRLVDRLKPQMVVRGIASGRDVLVTTALRDGDAWFAAIDSDHTTRFDFRFSRLVSGEIAIIGDLAYIPLRGKNALERVDIALKKRLPRLSLGPLPQGADPLGLLRTVLRWTRAPSAKRQERPSKGARRSKRKGKRR